MRWLDSFSENLKSKIQKRPRRLKWLGLSVIAFVLVVTGAVAQAQQPARIPRIGILIASPASTFSARVEALRQRLRELGYVEGKNIVIEYRYAEGKLERLPDLAAELVRLKVDVIVTGGPAILAAQKAGPTIPIVFTFAGDPVGSGLVSSLARPGGNITGLSLMSADLNGKRLELLKEAFPKVARVAFLWDLSARGNLALTEMETAARALGVKLQSLEVQSIDDFERIHASEKGRRPGAHYERRSTYRYSATSIVGLGGKEPVAGNLPIHRICRRRWLNELRAKQSGLMAACR
jgi:putative ABC transport system substrate-binding protein